MKKTTDLRFQNPQDFIKILTSNNISKFYFVYDVKQKKLLASHSILQPMADYFSGDKRDFVEHEGMFFQVSKKYEMLLGAFIHRTNRGQAAGGVRFWKYDNIENYFRDGIRLAAGMTFKNALAGLWWGGGKGVIAHNPVYEWNDPEVRKHIYKEYILMARFMLLRIHKTLDCCNLPWAKVMANRINWLRRVIRWK